MKEFKLFMLFVAVSISFVACDKDEDEVLKDYVGTWVAVYTEDGLSVKDQLILNEESMQEVIQVETTSGAFVDFMGLKGNLSVSGKTMNVTITSIGMAVLNFEAGTIGALEWFTESDEEYSDNIEIFGGENLVGEYAVSGDKLTLTIDGESVVYTKQ